MIGRLGDGHHHITTIIKDRFLGFLIWQSFHSTLIYFICKTLLSRLAPSVTLLAAVFAFLFFQLSLLLFSTSLYLVSSPQFIRGVSPFELLVGLVKLIFVYGGQPLPYDFRRRAKVTLSFVLFLASSGVSAFLSVVCLSGSQVFGAIGLRGLVVGLIYGSHYLFSRRWVLDFPIIQRPLFFSYKMGILKAIVKAVKLSSAGYLVSLVLPIFLVNEHKSERAMGDLVVEQILFYFASGVVFLCWELNRHLLQVFLTKRYLFAPPKGSAAAETNPSDHLLAALEETTPRSLLRHLAYLDLCMVSESNVDTWRRAAFFEETGDTYKKVIAVCLKPLEQLTLDLSEGLRSSPEKSFQLSRQLHSPTESSLREPFYDFQVCAWCARIASSLTVRSHKEDRFGVAQLSGSNAATISTLLACLLAVETLMGKKTNLQSSTQYLTGPANIKWAALSPARRDAMTTNGMTANKKDGPHYSKAYSMADILRTSIYQVVSNFHQEMVSSSKAGLLEKDWIVAGKPLYENHELLVQKLRLFLEFQAN
ncbi:uncharacterized protein LOC112524672 [Cynara cardunculus var. scolymus]|uniref:uncharacterized protein LOC112524672 n=1 Tax=Cynara cardunculus var. scolymus TaxID=59895 RepID=UPI000D630AF7|nr:uncharacterized protein LOC112524672 [Cynara cardunculus var. scolymus]